MTGARVTISRPVHRRPVHRYPSPRTSQPVRLRPVDDLTAELGYDLDRGLPAEPDSIPFGFVCAGIFVGLVARGAQRRPREPVSHRGNRPAAGSSADTARSGTSTA